MDSRPRVSFGDSAHFSLPVSLAPNGSAHTALEDFSTENKKTHSAGEWAKNPFSLISLTESPPAIRMDAT
jgi:hypothetical protein